MRSFLLMEATVICLTPASARAQVYGDSRSLVDHWYRAYLGREPDTGMDTWVNQLNQGVPANQVLTGILSSGEYYERAGSTPEGFIARLYNDILNRAPNSSELRFWVGRMYTEDRPIVVLQFLEQHPGVWIGSAAVSTPVPVGVPAVVPRYDWHRDWHHDWDRGREIYDYRRNDIYRHHGENDRH